MSTFPILLIALLHGMPFKHRIVVAFAFLLRLPLIPLAVTYITEYTKWSKHLSNPIGGSHPSPYLMGPHLVLPLVLQQCHLAWSLISAAIPCIRGFIRSFSNTFDTKYEHAWADHIQPASSPQRSDMNLENRSSVSQTQLQKPRPVDAATRRPSLLKGWKMLSTDGKSKAGHSPPSDMMDESSSKQMKLRPEKVVSKTTVYHSESPPPGATAEAQISLGESRERFIRQDIQWEVRRSDSETTV